MKDKKYTHCAKQSLIELFLLSNSKKFAIASILFILAFFVFTPLSQDDIDYFALQETSFDWLSNRYNNWSSRIVIESILPFLTNHEYIFKFITRVSQIKNLIKPRYTLVLMLFKNLY